MSTNISGKNQKEQNDVIESEPVADELIIAEQDLPIEIAEKKKRGVLKTGYTTGTTATAATKAALYALIHGEIINKIKVILPKGQEVELNVAWTTLVEGSSATAAVIKFAGDDPDVTDGAEICSTVSFIEGPGKVVVDGGNGVGRVTKPGLGLEIGKAAINPTPMKMLNQAVSEIASEALNQKGVKILISVPKGNEIAKKTDNPRLGIIGGISILGTTGIVLPYSTASFAASIRQSIDVAMAMGAHSVILTTGGRSEDFARELFPNLPDHSFVQIGDFAGFSIKQCANKRVEKAVIAGFIGKLTKMAMGIKQTHVRGSNVDLAFMAKLAMQCNAPSNLAEEIKTANTARHVYEIVMKNNVFGFFDLLCRSVSEQMQEYSNNLIKIEVIMFDFTGKVIGKSTG